ncbi:MAG TPA: NAD-dependent epimerase/dehydratase family protein [Flavisolibacter sp.]|nr:NAD-dependent epimerase/dehydratase family protein [Flavisolibacter sp.]
MKFVITGGAGFIGSHLSEKLVFRGHQVIAIDNESTGCAQNLSAIMPHPAFTYIHDDISAVNYWEQILSENTVIVHLAATVGVNRVAENPLETLYNNYTSTVSLLNLAARYACKFFFASTSEVYGDSDRAFSTESDSLVINGTHCGRTSYVLGKLLSEHYCLNYHQTHSLPVIVGRFFNVVGPRQLDRYGMVAPTFVKQALKNEPITIYGDGTQTRNFCDVNDITEAIIKSIDTKAAYGKILNFGGKDNITIHSFAQYVKLATHSASPIVFLPFPKERSNGRDIYHRSPSLARIENITGWKPITPWQDSVKAIISSLKHAQIDTSFEQRVIV